MVPEAPREATEHGLTVAGDGVELLPGVGPVLVVDRERRPEPLGDLGVRLPGLAVRRDAEEHQRHRDHRDDHDDREEEQQTAAEAHGL